MFVHLLAIIVCLFTAFIDGMEKTATLKKIHSWSYNYQGTDFNIIRDCLTHAKPPINFIVVGNAHQWVLTKNNDRPKFLWFVNTIIISNDKIIYKDATKHSQDNYQIYIAKPKHIFPELIVEFDKQKGAKSRKREMHCPVISIAEPVIMPLYYDDKIKKHVVGSCYRHDLLKEEPIASREAYKYYYEKEALRIASHHLKLCYLRTLQEGLYRLIDEKEKHIALALLSANVGFPRKKAIKNAVITNLYFIENNPKAYNSVTFFVKRRSDFRRFKLFLLRYSGLLYKICLFYWGNKDQDNILGMLPKELRDYIVNWII